MAARLPLKSSSLPFIWNVSARVGPGTENPNNSTDVELLKVLLAILMNQPQIAKFGISGNSLRPTRDGKFDTILGFWIYRMQQLGSANLDGIVSPAKGVNFAANSPWVIVSFNDYARQADAAVWQSLSKNTSLSAQLRAELSR
jgi:hypothetical protein